MNIFNIFNSLYNLIIDMFESFIDLFTFKFEILGITISFTELATTSLLAVMAVFLVKKFI